jgi:hypothetical protein
MAGDILESLPSRQAFPACIAGANDPHAAFFCAWVELTFSNACAHASLKGGAVNLSTGQGGGGGGGDAAQFTHAGVYLTPLSIQVLKYCVAAGHV